MYKVFQDYEGPESGQTHAAVNSTWTDTAWHIVQVLETVGCESLPPNGREGVSLAGQLAQI